MGKIFFDEKLSELKETNIRLRDMETYMKAVLDLLREMAAALENNKAE